MIQSKPNVLIIVELKRIALKLFEKTLFFIKIVQLRKPLVFLILEFKVRSTLNCTQML